MRAFAISAAILLCAAPAVAAPRSHAAAARKAERRGDWRKALREWKAAYAKEGNAEYLIAIGDAYSQLGNKTEARKSYEAYLADPLALPSRVEKVKTRIAQIEARNDSLALPALPLPDVSAVPAASTRVDPPLPRPARDAPPAAEPPPVALPRVDPSPAARKDSIVAPPAARESAPLLMTTPAAVPDKQAPVAAVSTAAPFPQPSAGSSRAQRTMAYVTASVAVAALGGGALAFTQANSVHGELTGSVHTAAETQRLLEDERRYRTLSLVGFAGGLIAAGIATALFVF
jgi:hypothetical protein